MSKLQQYDIYPKQPANRDWQAFGRDIQLLKQQIYALAKTHSEPVYSAKISDTPRNSELGGMVGVLIECSDSFLDKVRALPLFGEAQLGCGYDIERASLISAAAQPKPPAGPRR